jgi:hypothetical protein
LRKKELQHSQKLLLIQKHLGFERKIRGKNIISIADLSEEERRGEERRIEVQALCYGLCGAAGGLQRPSWYLCA